MKTRAKDLKQNKYSKVGTRCTWKEFASLSLFLSLLEPEESKIANSTKKKVVNFHFFPLTIKDRLGPRNSFFFFFSLLEQDESKITKSTKMIDNFHFSLKLQC